MGWSEILNIVFGGTSLVSIIAFFIYFKENKALKKNEVKNSDTAAQTQQIELAELYKNKVVELTELMLQMAKKQDSGNENQILILQNQARMDARMDRHDERLADIVTYLNGDFQEFLRRQQKGEDNV